MKKLVMTFICMLVLFTSGCAVGEKPSSSNTSTGSITATSKPTLPTTTHVIPSTTTSKPTVPSTTTTVPSTTTSKPTVPSTTTTVPSTTTSRPTVPNTTTTVPSTTTSRPTVPSTTTTVPSTTTSRPTVPSTTTPTTTITTTTPVDNNIEGYKYLSSQSNEVISNFGADGFVKDKIGDFSQYEGTSAYVQVTTPNELLDALLKAKYEYTNTWVYDPRNDDEKVITDRLNELDVINKTIGLTKTEKTERTTLEGQVKTLAIPGHVEQALTSEGTIHVIEIMNDLDMGFYKLDQTKVNSGNIYDSVIDDFSAKNSGAISNLTMSDMFTESGMSQIKVENTSNLLIYSKNGAKLTHCGIKLTSDTNVVIRNLEFDELWQWEDSSSATPDYTIGDYDAFGWSYFKVSFCGYVWIDHCTFGKSYDGQIDYSNPVYNVNKSVSGRAPYGADGGNGLHISNCRFNAGSDDPNGYIYKQMLAAEEDYQNNGGQYLYYKTLRDMNISFEEILYGIAIPQKKGFLLGDSGDYYDYNTELKVSFANNVLMNIEDRLPKVRGGIAYLYNNVIDSWQYYKYRTTLISKGAKNINTINGKYKCALVSQGIVCGLGGSVYAENTIYRGVSSLLKNNDNTSGITTSDDVSITSDQQKGGYRFINVTYHITEPTTPYTGSTTKTNHKFNTYNETTSTLTTVKFNWHNENNTQPFTPALYEDDLLTTLNTTCPVGVNANIADMYLYTKFSDYTPR